MGIILLALCTVTCGLAALAIARRFGRDAQARFWIFTIALPAQLGFLAGLLSIFHQLTPIAWTVAQLLIALIVISWTARPSPAQIREPAPVLESWTLASVLLIALTILFVILPLVEQIGLPVAGVDDRGYQCSRTIYWIQHHHLFPWTTHNIRQDIFPFGGELFFFFPVLLTRTELAGRLFLATSLPLIVAGTYFTLIQLALPRKHALIGALAMALTPAMYRITVGGRPDLWVGLFSLGFTFWAIRCIQQPSRQSIFMLAMMFIFAVNVKTTALCLFLPLLVVVFYRRHFFAALSGVVLAIALCGLWVTWGYNLKTFGRLLGPTAVTVLHQPTYSPVQVLTHLERAPLELIEFPILPESLRNGLEQSVVHLAHSIGADRALAKEEPNSIWPGPYLYYHTSPAHKFSLPGLIWIPALIAALFLLRKRREIPIIALIAWVTFVSVVLFIRWLQFGPERFWLLAFSPALVLEALLLSRWKARWFTIICLAWMLVAGLVAHVVEIRWMMSGNYGPDYPNEPFVAVLPKIPPDAHLLVFLSQSDLDYPLFGPRIGYTREVYSWGTNSCDEHRLMQMIRHDHITQILIENSPVLDFIWFPQVSTAPFFRLFMQSSEFQEIPTEGHFTLFAVKPNLQ